MQETTPVTYPPLAGIGPRRIARYMVVVVRMDQDTPQLIVSDYWDDWVEMLYVLDRSSVLQVFCSLGRGYFGD